MYIKLLTSQTVRLLTTTLQHELSPPRLPVDRDLVRRVTNNQTAAPGLERVTYKNTMQLKYGIP